MINVFNPIGCQHPIAIDRNGVQMVVPCGHCKLCRLKKDSVLSARVQAESLCHRYIWQCTLTYDNDHIPYIELSELQDMYPGTNFKTIQNMEKPAVGVLRYEDVQKFLKRVRVKLVRIPNSIIKKHNKRVRKYNKIHKNDFNFKPYHEKELFTQRDINFRFFCVGEYGPHTHRPHYHVLFFFDSQFILKYIQTAILKSWSLCSPNRLSSKYSNLVKGDAAQYIAGYLSSSIKLPQFYQQQREYRPFFSGSQNPAIGFSQIPEQEIYDSFIDESFQISSSDPTTHMVSYVPYSKYICNKFFPKCKGYSHISHAERFDIYKNAYLSVCRAFDNLHESGDLSSFDTFSEIYGVSPSDSSELEILHHEKILNVNSYKIRDRLKYNIEFYHPEYLDFQNFRASRAALLFCKKTGITLTQYLYKLDKLYQTRALSSLSRTYHAIEKYQEKFTTGRLDLFFCYDILSNDYTLNEFKILRSIYQNYGINLTRYYNYCFDFDKNFLYKDQYVKLFNTFAAKDYDNNVVDALFQKKIDRKLHKNIINNYLNPLTT